MCAGLNRRLHQVVCCLLSSCLVRPNIRFSFFENKKKKEKKCQKRFISSQFLLIFLPPFFLLTALVFVPYFCCFVLRILNFYLEWKTNKPTVCKININNSFFLLYALTSSIRIVLVFTFGKEEGSKHGDRSIHNSATHSRSVRESKGIEHIVHGRERKQSGDSL